MAVTRTKKDLQPAIIIERLLLAIFGHLCLRYTNQGQQLSNPRRASSVPNASEDG
ncbi:ser/threonine protein phosphatase [Anopheles sinensis]|uniref:Ser/threonine protein phosphatase n=1 Tax=Anopheles sinensis TaxID=74873 RepID=A0A084VBA2_ANOSI|nr:ser/threonine protein phosphatase [Anopheles sinensis]